MPNREIVRGHRPRLQFSGIVRQACEQVYYMNVPRKCYLSRRQLLRGALALPLSVFGCRRSEPAKTEKSGPQVVDLYGQSDGDFLAFKPDELTCVTGTVVRLKFHHRDKVRRGRRTWVLGE